MLGLAAPAQDSATANHIYGSDKSHIMNKGCVLIAVLIPSFVMVPTQMNITIVQFDQYYELLPDGNMMATWEITILPDGNEKNMVLHAFFSKKAYIKELVVSDALGSLSSRVISREDVPLIEVTFRERLSPGAEYYFTCRMEVWKAADIGETEGSFTVLTGYNFPVDDLNVAVQLPEGTRLRNYFPADGRVSGEPPSVSWSMSSLPEGYSINISVAFDVLSKTFADNLFSDAENLYRLKDFENSRKKFEEAQKVYESLNLRDEVRQCTVYLDRITGMEQGLPVFEEAVTLYKNEEYEKAATKFEQVKTIYEEHNIDTAEVDTYISDCSTYMKAFDELEKAENYVREGKYDEAREHFMNAKNFFSDVADSAMMQEIDAKLEQIKPVETKESEPPQTETGRRGTGLLLMIFVVIGVIAFVVMKLRKPAVVQTEDEIREEMRELKARYVYGEINKKQYEERLAPLEEQLKSKKAE
jgi:tetratricopeptide (TPR) repeat protein